MSAQLSAAGDPFGGDPAAAEEKNPGQVEGSGTASRRSDPEDLAELFRALSGPRPRARPIRRGGRVRVGGVPERPSSGPPPPPGAPPPGHFTEVTVAEEAGGPVVGAKEEAGGADEAGDRERVGAAAVGEAEAPVGWSFLDAAGRLAHDVRNPLTSLEVVGYVLAAELKPLDRPDLDALVGEIFEVRHRVTLGIEELVEFSRVADGRTEIARDWTRLGDVVDDALRDAGYYRAGSVVYRESPDRAELVAFVDGPRLRMIVRSLVRYLLDYGRAPVRVGVQPVGDGFELRIEDSSDGGTPEGLAETMGRLEAGPALGAPFGAGLGLFVCRPIIEAHGGSLTAEVGARGTMALVIVLPRGEERDVLSAG